MAQAYVTAIFPDEGSARAARAQAEQLLGVEIQRSYLIRRDGNDFVVDGGPAPHYSDAKQPHSALYKTFQRLWTGNSSEEDAQAVDDVELQLRGTQTALVMLAVEGADTLETALAAAGGATRTASPETLDAEDTRRFLGASSLSETN